jgi:flagellar basal body-associated protein FliL
MAVPFTKSRYRTLLIIIASIIIVIASAAGAITLLKHFAPEKLTGRSVETTEQPAVSPLKKAEDLFAKGHYSGAKAQYQTVLETYKSENNQAGIADVKMQLQIIEKAAAATPAPQNTDKGKVSAGPAQKK